MDIAHRLGLGGTPKISKLAEFAVALVGLSDNPTHGPCAQRGVPLRAEPSGPVPAGVSYQWHVAGEGPITGATEASFTPDAPLAAESAIFCVVTAPGQGSSASAPVVFRDAAPQLGATLFDEVFDLDTGPQIVEVAAGFTGLNLRFAVSGAGAEIDPVTGDVAVPTDMERDGDVVVVTATNSGGATSAAFQVTIEDVAVEGALPFGALTPAGAGGVPVNGAAIASGDPKGHWQIAGGMLVPSRAGEGALSGFYPLVLDSGDRVDVMIEDDKASARPDEIAAVFARLPLTARGLMVQDGDARPLGRIRLEPRVFEREMVLEPVNWLEDPDPRQSLRPVTLAGLTIGGDPSGDRVLRMENLTVQGFVCQMETGPGETEFNNGIILVERPSRHVTIRQNEIWSRTTADIVANDDYRDNVATSRQMRGLATKVYSGTNEHIQIEDNHFHDVTRGAVLTATSHYHGVRSRFCGNIIEDCYTNFFTAGYLDGLDIFDNRCIGVYAANGDTLGAIPKTSPHSACGGSFDAGGSRTTANVTMMGNFFHTGWKRTVLCADMGLPKPTIGATGVKFNDPRAADSYWNLIVAFNTVISHGPSMEISGADSDTHIDVFNNTLASESYAGAGSVPVFSFNGAQKMRLFNNIACDYVIGSEDNKRSIARTFDDLQGYGNLHIRGGATADFGEGDYFIGDPVKGLNLLTIDEAMSAYVPKPETRAMTAAQKKGALGTRLYHGNGVHDVAYEKPVVTTGVSHVYVPTQWNGSYLRRKEAMLNTGTPVQGLTFAFQGQSAPSLAGSNAILFSMAGQRVYIRMSGNGTVVLKAESGSDTFIEGYGLGGNLGYDQGLASFVCSMDFQKGVMLIAVNGTLTDWLVIRALERKSLSLYRHNPRIFANEATAAGDRWQGDMGLFYLADSFVDLETPQGLGQFYAADGGFVDFGVNGSKPTGTTPLIFLSGNTGGGTANLGTGGAFTLI